jgi:hypothetical protein
MECPEDEQVFGESISRESTVLSRCDSDKAVLCYVWTLRIIGVSCLLRAVFGVFGSIFISVLYLPDVPYGVIVASLCFGLASRVARRDSMGVALILLFYVSTYRVFLLIITCGVLKAWYVTAFGWINASVAVISAALAAICYSQIKTNGLPSSKTDSGQTGTSA